MQKKTIIRIIIASLISLFAITATVISFTSLKKEETQINDEEQSLEELAHYE